jgi:DNA-binding winged helix-turn-helix (wHTH) protein/tetratricopeptide (TPR) repeat protein
VSEPTKPAPDEPFLAGEFLVVPERNELRRIDDKTLQASSEPLRLTSKQMGVLLVLAAKPGQPVSKNELFDAVWPGVSVGEDNITSCMYALRQAFGDQAYIKTVRQRGYLLNAAVVRPAPAELVAAAAAPEKPATRDIVVPVADLESLAAPVEPLPRQALDRLDRQGRRQLAIWMGVLALLVTGGLFGLDHFGTLTVALTGFSNTTGDRDLNPVAISLERRLTEALNREEGSNHYRVRDLRFFAGTQVHCEIRKGEDDLFELHATVSGRTGEPEAVKLTGSRESLERLGGKLIESVQRILDDRACRMESAVDLYKAKHCSQAGGRQVKARSYSEAGELLSNATKFYSQVLVGPDRQEAAAGLLGAYDDLANVYDIQGEREKATEQIDAALLLLADPANGFRRVDELQILRRKAQIGGDVNSEKKYLDELRDLEPENDEWRHSFGWFLQTHERDCDYSELQFDEARADAEDPLIRATYYSYQGDLQLACGEPKKAITSYDKHIEATPEVADPYDMRGHAYLMVGRYSEAREDFRKALQLDDTLATAQLGKGHLDRELGHFRDAEREYQTFLDRFGKWPNFRRDYLIATGRLALLEERPSEAEKNAREAIELKGGQQVEAFWLLGLAKLRQRDLGEAKAAAGKLEGFFVSPSRYLREYLHHLRAQIALAEGRGQDALRELELALENRPADRLFFLAAKAEALEELDRHQEAYAAYKGLLEVNFKHARSLCAAAGLAERLSLPQEAGTLYADALGTIGQRSDDPVCRKCLERGRAYGEVR